jgi:hypothetical protein
MKKHRLFALTAIFGLVIPCAAVAQERSIIVASTTSTVCWRIAVPGSLSAISRRL